MKVIITKLAELHINNDKGSQTRSNPGLTLPGVKEEKVYPFEKDSSYVVDVEGTESSDIVLEGSDELALLIVRLEMVISGCSDYPYKCKTQSYRKLDKLGKFIEINYILFILCTFIFNNIRRIFFQENRAL